MKKRKAKRRLVNCGALASVVDESDDNYSGYGYEVPPPLETVYIYFNQKAHSSIAESFFKYFENRGWKSTSGIYLKNWKVAASNWIFEHEQSLKLIERIKANRIVDR
ncbi:hypothetical protein [Arcticibacter tournemirensis]